MARLPASRQLVDRACALRLAGVTLLALACSAAACGLDSSGAGLDSTAGGGGHGNGTAANAGGTGGESLTIGSGGSSVSTSSTGADGGAGGAGTGGDAGAGGAFPCEGDGLYEGPMGHCYHYILVKDNWLNAQAGCKTWGGSDADLAAISFQAEYDFVAAVPGLPTNMWIGGRDFDPIDTTVGYEWSNGEMWGFSPSGTPPALDPAKPCIKLHNDAFDPHACSEAREYLCERY
jgi:hypothetical protein